MKAAYLHNEFMPCVLFSKHKLSAMVSVEQKGGHLGSHPFKGSQALVPADYHKSKQELDQ